MPSRLYDAHNHLQDVRLAPYLGRIAEAAAALPIAKMLVNGTAESDWARVAALAQQFPFVHPSYGLHPWHVGNRSPAWLDQLKARLSANPAAAVGEIGLDRWMLERARPDDQRLAGLRRASLEEQTEAFLAQLQIAATENRPVTLHCLHAWAALDHLLEVHAVPARGFLLHAYGGPPELVPRLSERGAYFSFNANSLERPERKSLIFATFKRVPLDRLLVETDAPAMPLPLVWRSHKLPPAPDGSPLNHPGNLEAAYTALAMIRDISRQALVERIEDNFLRYLHPSSDCQRLS